MIFMILYMNYVNSAYFNFCGLLFCMLFLYHTIANDIPCITC